MPGCLPKPSDCHPPRSRKALSPLLCDGSKHLALDLCWQHKGKRNILQCAVHEKGQKLEASSLSLFTPQTPYAE